MRFKNDAHRQPYTADDFAAYSDGSESDPCDDDYATHATSIDDRAVTMTGEPVHESWFSQFISDGGAIVRGTCQTSQPSPWMRWASLQAAAATGSNLSCETSIRGVAAPYEVMSNMADRNGNAVIYRQGCFARSLKSDRRDIFVLHNFLESRVIGRTRSGSAAIWESSTGLEFEVVGPNTFWMRDLLVSVNRRDLSSATCLCIPAASNVEVRGDQRVKVIQEAELILISVTAFAPFNNTSALTTKQTAQSAAATVTFNDADRTRLHGLGVVGMRF